MVNLNVKKENMPYFAILYRMKPTAFIFIGRYGAGKGTQAELLIKKFQEQDPANPPLYMYTGARLRKYIQEEGHTAKLTKKVVESGGLMPEFMPIYIWSGLLVENYKGTEHLVFDGSPRRLLEAKILETAFPFYGLGKPIVIHLDVHHDESHKRLVLRAKTNGRPDDGPAEIEIRKRAYEADIIPVVEYYRTSPLATFLNIDGVRSIEEVHADIVKQIGLQ